MNNTIEALEADYLYLNNSQIMNSGKGLFTAIPIYKEEIIAVFKGNILNAAQAKAIADKNEDQYFINLLNGKILDSRPVECFAKYANDASGFSKSVFKNNAKITLDENNNVCLTALRKIKEGEDLFCSYGKRYWKKHYVLF
jgi:uncharacterized protein